jgi:Fe2+ or Zn2+ uptake regulation protein
MPHRKAHAEHDHEEHAGHAHGDEGCGCRHEPGSADQVRRRLRTSGVRLTKPRERLIEILAATHAPATIEQLHAAIGHQSCDLATMYRNLAAFEKVGVVRRMHFETGAALFELEASPEHHHHHVVCRVCRSVEAVAGCVVAPVELEVRRRGYSDVTHVVEFFGVCPKCRDGAPAADHE